MGSRVRTDPGLRPSAYAHVLSACYQYSNSRRCIDQNFVTSFTAYFIVSFIFLIQCTVELLLNDHPQCKRKSVLQEWWSLIRGTVSDVQKYPSQNPVGMTLQAQVDTLDYPSRVSYVTFTFCPAGIR